MLNKIHKAVSYCVIAVVGTVVACFELPIKVVAFAIAAVLYIVTCFTAPIWAAKGGCERLGEFVEWAFSPKLKMTKKAMQCYFKALLK